MINSEVQLNAKDCYPKLVRNTKTGSVAIAISAVKLVKIVQGNELSNSTPKVGDILDFKLGYQRSNWVELPVGSKVVLEQV